MFVDGRGWRFRDFGCLKDPDMNFLMLLIIAVSLLVLEFVFLILRRKKDRKLNINPDHREIDKKSPCQVVEDCWCYEYNLSKEKKEQLLEEFEDLHCGKSVESVLKNKW